MSTENKQDLPSKVKEFISKVHEKEYYDFEKLTYEFYENTEELIKKIRTYALYNDINIQTRRFQKRHSYTTGEEPEKTFIEGLREVLREELNEKLNTIKFSQGEKQSPYQEYYYYKKNKIVIPENVMNKVKTLDEKIKEECDEFNKRMTEINKLYKEAFINSIKRENETKKSKNQQSKDYTKREPITEAIIPKKLQEFMQKTGHNLETFENKLYKNPEEISTLIHKELKHFQQRKKLIKTIRKYYIPEIKTLKEEELHHSLKKMYTKKKKYVKKFLKKYKEIRKEKLSKYKRLLPKHRGEYPKLTLKRLENYFFDKKTLLEKHVRKVKLRNYDYMRAIKKTFILPSISVNRKESKNTQKNNTSKLDDKIYHLSVFDNLRKEHLKSNPEMFKAKIYAIIDSIEDTQILLKPSEVPALVDFGDDLIKVLEKHGPEVLNKTVTKLLKESVLNAVEYTAFVIGDTQPIKEETTKQDYTNFWNKMNKVVEKNVKQVLDTHLRREQGYQNPIVTFNQPVLGEGIKDLISMTEQKLEDLLTSPAGVEYVSEIIGHGSLEFVSRQVLLPARIGIPDVIMKKKNEDLYYLIELKDQQAVPKDLMQTGSYMNYFANYINKYESYPLDTHQIKKITGVLLATSMPKRNHEEFMEQAENLGIQLRVLTEDFYKIVKEEPLTE